MVLGAILMAGGTITAGVLVVQAAVIPLVIRYSTFVQRKIVFWNFLKYPRNVDYANPASSNLYGGRNFQIEFHSHVDNCKIQLGAWHLVPRSQFRDVSLIRDEVVDKRLLEQLKNTSHTVVLYCHGNSNHRGSPNRLRMYKVFQDLNFHVITFDYRGYGDSTNVRPSERGLVEDSLQVYTWLMKSLNPDEKPTVLLWGHSLGSSVVANLVSNFHQLCQDYNIQCPLPPDAIVLESPFNNLLEEIESHPFSKAFSWLPYYKKMLKKPFSSSPEFIFATDRYLQTVPRVPVLILHAKGDKIVPYELAVKLHNDVEKSRINKEDSGDLVLYTFDKGRGLGHNNLGQAEELKTVVRSEGLDKWLFVE